MVQPQHAHVKSSRSHSNRGTNENPGRAIFQVHENTPLPGRRLSCSPADECTASRADRVQPKITASSTAATPQRPMNCRDPGWPVEVARRQRSAHSRNSRKLATKVLSKSVPAHAPFKISEVSHQFPDLVSTTSKTFSSSEFVRKGRCFDVARKLHNEQLTVERRRASVARAEERAATTALQFFQKGTITNLNISCQSLRYFNASSKNRRCFWDASARMLNTQSVFDLRKGTAVE